MRMVIYGLAPGLAPVVGPSFCLGTDVEAP
jgi:hypothetical protein